MKNTHGGAPLKVAVLTNSGFDARVGLDIQTLDNKYLLAIRDGCDALPVMVPTLFDAAQIGDVLDLVDGVILTGDQSNIAPGRYGVNGDLNSHGPFDELRDSVAFNLVSGAAQRGIPVLGICRGMQEINVAFGGSLRVDFEGNVEFPSHPGSTETSDPERIYANAHQVTVDLATRFGAAIGASRVCVNSAHVQAIDRLAENLVPVALSDDGIVEAFEHRSNPRILGVQWHPEYRATDSALSMAIFGHFAAFMRENAH